LIEKYTRKLQTYLESFFFGIFKLKKITVDYSPLFTYNVNSRDHRRRRRRRRRRRGRKADLRWF
jgi:hypothetical protein